MSSEAARFGPGVSGVDTQDLEGISSGAYTVEVTDANGCSTTEAFNITTSIAELEGGVSALVFPNPSSGMFQVNVEGGQSGPVNFMVVDAQGRTVRRGQWTMAGMVQPLRCVRCFSSRAEVESTTIDRR